MKSSGNFWRKYRWCWKCAERAFATEKLIHYFRQIPDYRCGREKKHDLAEMLVYVTLVKQVRIPSEKDSQGNDVTPSKAFREDRSPAKKSRNNLSLIRKYAYNILRMAMYETGLTNIMTEMMDCFCDNAALRERYVFQGIASLY